MASSILLVTAAALSLTVPEAVDIADAELARATAAIPVVYSELNGYEQATGSPCDGSFPRLPLGVTGAWIEIRFAAPLRADGMDVVFMSPDPEQPAERGRIEIQVADASGKWAKAGVIGEAKLLGGSRLGTMRPQAAETTFERRDISAVRLVWRGLGRVVVRQVRPIVDGEPVSCRAVEKPEPR